MRTKPFLILTFLVSGCSGVKPITIASANAKVMAGQLIHDRLVSAQSKLGAALDKGNMKAAPEDVAETEAVWESHKNPTVDNWNKNSNRGQHA